MNKIKPDKFGLKLCLAVPLILFLGGCLNLKPAQESETTIPSPQATSEATESVSSNPAPATTITSSGEAVPTATLIEPTLTVISTIDISSAITISIDVNKKYQTIHGWEAVAQSGRKDCPGFELYKDSLFDQAVNDLGITRIRLEIPSGLENPSGIGVGFEAVNDNNDPNHIDPEGFNFKRLDPTIQEVIIPIRERLAARGEKLWINATLVDFEGNKPGTWEHRDYPEEYAEFVLGFYQYMQNQYGFTPDSWEVILEADTSANWLGRQIGPAVAAAGKRLVENGFTPRFVAPSVTNLMNASGHIREMMNTPAIQPWLYEFSYHRYGGGIKEFLTGIAGVSEKYDIPTAMLEHVKADYKELYQDLTWANASAWEQYTLAYCNGDRGEAYYYIDITKPDNPVINMGQRTRYLRQFFHFIRPGDVRIDASSLNPLIQPVAFMDEKGRIVSVIIAEQAGVLNIQGLPDGAYGINYTTQNQYSQELGPVESQAGSMFFQAPDTGVYSVYPYNQTYP